MRPLRLFAVSSLIAAALCLCVAGMCAAQDPATRDASAPAQNPSQSDSAGTPALKLTAPALFVPRGRAVARPVSL